jgi:hypothetical protein
MILEQLMEDKIAEDPEKYLGEKGLRLVARQYPIGEYRLDLIFEDRRGAKLIVELQRGKLDRAHTYKIMDYYDEYKEAHPRETVELMIIANHIPKERKARLSSHGISFREIPEIDFIDNDQGAGAADGTSETWPGKLTARGPNAVVPRRSIPDCIPALKHPRNRSPRWDSQAMAKIEEWMRKKIAGMHPGATVSIGDFAKESRSVAHILPKGNIDGGRYILSLVAREGSIDFPDNLHFRVLNRQDE